MADVFFDLGKLLPKMSNEAVHTHLKSNDEIHEIAFEPSSKFEPIAPKKYAQIVDRKFDRVRFYEVKFHKITFRKCVFDRCLFLSAEIFDCEFHECIFIECNTNKIKFIRTYIDPRSFTGRIFDKRKYSNIGVDLFQALLKNSSEESQPDFKSVAEYNFRLWKRYNQIFQWTQSSGCNRWFNFRFYIGWLTNIISQKFTGYGLRVTNILISALLLVLVVGAINHYYWDSFLFATDKMKNISYTTKLMFFTVGNLSTFGTGDLTPNSDFGFKLVAIEVLLGLVWIAVSTSILVKRLIR